MKLFLESCCTSLDEVIRAQKAGAGRIELCEELSVGGVTPSRELLQAVLDAATIPVNVLVRPRGGDFHFNENEIQQMLESIRLCRAMRSADGLRHVNGVVIGALDARGDVDMPTMQRLISAARGDLDMPTMQRLITDARGTAQGFAGGLAGGRDEGADCGLAGGRAEDADCGLAGGSAEDIPALEITFHRAFDVCRDPIAAFEDVLSLGCDRLLTSGHESDAYRGRHLIARLVRRAAEAVGAALPAETAGAAAGNRPSNRAAAGNKLIVMAGCGVRPGNVEAIIADSGVSEVHASASWFADC